MSAPSPVPELTRSRGNLVGVLALLFAAGGGAMLFSSDESPRQTRQGNSHAANPAGAPENFVQKSSPASSRQQILQRFVRECISVEPGTAPFPREFLFGSAEQERHAIPQRAVTMITQFRISQFEVTQELYETVMKVNPSRWRGPRNSAESMSFSDAGKFCELLTALMQAEQLIAANEVVRLPTEVEWEYCCRGGTTTRYSFGDEAATAADVKPKASLLDHYAWHTGNAAGNDPEVGILKPNAWGLFDMHGYLSEFVSDPWSTDAETSVGDDAEARQNRLRVIRGGSWRDSYAQLTSTSRMPMQDTEVSDAVGFRCLIARQP